MSTGYIYKIYNDINDKIYIGQTIRDIQDRFNEHLRTSFYPSECNSKLHRAIVKYGREHFFVEQVEEVSLSELDGRERYWIKYYNSTDKEKGYNITIGGSGVIEPGIKLHVVENSIVFESKELAARLIAKQLGYGATYISHLLTEAVEKKTTFCDYHFEYLPVDSEVSDELTIEDWIITLKLTHPGQRLFCQELNMYFETSGEAARYVAENYYTGRSKMPIQTLISSFSQGFKVLDYIYLIQNVSTPLTFYKVPGESSWRVQQVKPYAIYCPELDKTFENQTKAAQYFLEQEIWTGIKLKTAKIRISDVVRGVFPDYKGYTFKRAEN